MDFFQLDTTPENEKMKDFIRFLNENFPISDTRNNFVLEFLIILLILQDIPLMNVLKEDYLQCSH
jgi:hypothetical protein